MLSNGSQKPHIPPAQLAVFKCPECGDSIFEVKKCCRMVFDRLDADQDLRPVPVVLVQCVKCHAFITRDRETKGWIAVHAAGSAPEEGEEWKT